MGQDDIKDLQQFFVDTLKSLSALTKKIDEMNKNMISKTGKIEEKISDKLDELKSYFESIRNTAELLNELLPEMRLLVPVLHLTKLLDETKTIFSGISTRTPSTAPMMSKQTSKTEPLREGFKQDSATQQPFAAQRPSFAPEKVEFKEEEPKKEQTPDVVYSSKVPSYIKDKKKPKSIWEGIRDEEE